MNLFRPPVAEISKEVRSTAFSRPLPVADEGRGNVNKSELPCGESRRLRLRTGSFRSTCGRGSNSAAVFYFGRCAVFSSSCLVA